MTDPVPLTAILTLQPLPGQDADTFEATRRRILAILDRDRSTPSVEEHEHDPEKCWSCAEVSEQGRVIGAEIDATPSVDGLREALAAYMCDGPTNPKPWSERTEVERDVSGFRQRADRIIAVIDIGLADSTPSVDGLRELQRRAEANAAMPSIAGYEALVADLLAALAATPTPALDADRHLPDCDAPGPDEPCTCVSRAEALAATPTPAAEPRD